MDTATTTGEMVETYKTTKRFTIASEVRGPGEFIPEATDFTPKILERCIRTRYIEKVWVRKETLDAWYAERKKAAAKDENPVDDTEVEEEDQSEQGEPVLEIPEVVEEDIDLGSPEPEKKATKRVASKRVVRRPK